MRPTSQRPPCPRHGLATGPDGRCTLCKREALGSYRPPEPEAPSGASRTLTALVGAAALASVGAALSIALGWVDFGGSSQLMASTERVERAATRRPARPSRGFEADEPVAQAQAPSSIPQAEDPRVPEPLEGTVGAAPLDDPRAVAERERKLKEEAERDQKRRDMINADMELRAKRRARADVSIVMYSTKWCPYCTKARDYMTRNQLAFVEHDIEADEAGRAANKRLNPKGSIPTISMDDEVLLGFSDDSFERTLEAAARKRIH